MGKWAKYSKKYNPAWEKEPAFKNWLTRSSSALIDKGMPEAYCSICKCCLRPHKSDLDDHRNSKKHRLAEKALPSVKANRQPSLASFGFQSKTEQSKIIDLRMSAHVACHSSIRTIDHLGEVLNSCCKEKGVFEMKLHRTKCSKIIAKVVAPCMLKDLVADVGDSWFSLIVDESTDTATAKHLGIMIKYYSFTKKKMIVDFLGLLETPEATSQKLYEAVKEFLNQIGLKLKRLYSLGTDGGLNLCGAQNSLFALLKRHDCPNLHLIKCVCHGLDKCASKSSSAFPPSLEFLLRESRNWFSHSAVRKVVYERQYKELTGGGKPPQLVKLGDTRWLSWYGAVKAHSEQYDQLKCLFRTIANADQREKCPMAHQLAQMHEDGTHKLYLAFLRPFLRELVSLNVAFQSSLADISRVYSDLRTFVFTVAKAVIKPEALKESQGGMLRLSELQALKIALQRPENFKPIPLVSYGENFWKVATELKLSDEKLKEVQTRCADFLVKFTHELVNRLPSCIDEVQKMRAFTPTVALAARGRPQFSQLPLGLVRDETIDREAMEMQWNKLGSLTLEDICPGEGLDLESIDTVTFWCHVWELKTGAGERAFKDLARFVLAALVLPLSNAMVERLFSILGIVKSKLRNRMCVEMLSAILRVRIHLQANGMCCNSFTPSREMIDNFCSKTMYGPRKPKSADQPSSSHDEEWEVDNPDEENAPQVAIGLTLEDGDIDSVDQASVPEWDEMFDLLAEVDAMTEN